MSQNLTQPEEIDCILRAMAICGPDKETPFNDPWANVAIKNENDGGLAAISGSPSRTEN